MRKRAAIASLLLLAGVLAAQSNAPERTVHGNIITSRRDPHVRIELPDTVKYVGADRWVLYGIADCELHAFIDADAQKNVQRLYWVQFEQYLPTKPDLHHTYDSPRHAQIGGWDFFVDTWVRSNTAKIDPGSDREHIEELIRAKGYKMPAGMMYVRLVHLLDEQKRKEVMIIYGEDLASTGFNADELGEHGKAHDRWPVVEKDLIQRAEQKIGIEPMPAR
ncbi:MAG: hypothetical protein ACRD3Q_02050 [Terriglobales bacterium]